VISPILANVYLHYVYDLWTHRWRRKATGDVIVTRYADDSIAAFSTSMKRRLSCMTCKKECGSSNWHCTQ
jgi:hypothetical protein